MSREHPLVARKKERLAQKKAELIELRLRCEAIALGIAEDEADLELARVKQSRKKKVAETRPPTAHAET